MITTMVGKLVIFEGNVQGVGFRYTARSLARQYLVTGYVLNRDDGAVEVVAEGPNEDVEAFIRSLQEEMAEYIRDVKIQDQAVTGHYPHFTVKF
jgi:acylphosphatase